MTYIAIGIPIFGMIFLVKLIEKEIPRLLQRKRKEWELEKTKEDYRKNVKKIQEDRVKKVAEHKVDTLKEKVLKKEEEIDLYPLHKKPTKKMTYKEKVEKGKRYETYIANYFKEQGYYVWEHGKEKGKKDKSIDLFVRKENHAYFIQCKDWARWKIKDKEIKATRTDVREYLKENKEFWKLIKEKDIKILYVTSKECLTKGAYRYIQENKEIIELEVIPID